MIEFSSENQFRLKQKKETSDWLNAVIASEKKSVGKIDYVFCDDDFLLELNKTYLNHDTLTDIISFDYSKDDSLEGEIYISTERVAENAKKFDVGFEGELRRVIVHGILHLCGYRDKTERESKKMRQKEDEKLKLFHVEHNPRNPSKSV